MGLDKYEMLYNQMEQQKSSKTKRVAAYCRVSTDQEDQTSSFESQRRFFRQYIGDQPGWELYEVFADEGITGTNTKKRKEFNRMIECARNGCIDLIITKEISRFARNTLDSIYYTRELKKYGVGVIFMNDNINTLDQDAELRLTIMSSIAQDESRRTSERVKWGQKRRMEQGVVFGRSMLGYDVRGGRMYVNEEGAKVVQYIFHKFVSEGKGTHTIARELREEGILPMRVAEWSNTVILRLLRNEKYCGDLVQKKTITPDYLSHEKKYNRGEEEFVIIKDHHEPIVSRELFEKANRILDQRSLSQVGISKHSNRYLFSGKIKCGCCGRTYVARYKDRQDGSQYKAWRCGEAAKHGGLRTDKAGNRIGCSSHSIRDDDAMHIMSLVMKNLKYNREKITENLLKAIRSVLSDASLETSAKPLQKQIADLNGKQARLLELYVSNKIDEEEFSEMRGKYDAEIAALKTEMDRIEHGKDLKEQQSTVFADIVNAVNELADGVEYEDEFYKPLLDKMVVIDADNVDVYLNILPQKWRFSVAKAAAEQVQGGNSDAPMPISVRAPMT